MLLSLEKLCIRMVDGFAGSEDNIEYHDMVSDARRGGVIGPFMLNIMSKRQLGRACYLCGSIKCLAVQRTVVPGNWMDSRQSDNSIVPMIASNAEGGKGVAKGYISARNLHRTQGRMNGG